MSMPPCSATAPVLLDGTPVGRLDGLEFVASVDDGQLADKPVRQALRKVLRRECGYRIRRLMAADDDAFTLKADGTIRHDDAIVARLKPGASLRRPEVVAPARDYLPETETARLAKRLADIVHRRIDSTLSPLVRLEQGALSGAAVVWRSSWPKIMAWLRASMCGPSFRRLTPRGGDGWPVSVCVLASTTSLSPTCWERPRCA